MCVFLLRVFGCCPLNFPYTLNPQQAPRALVLPRSGRTAWRSVETCNATCMTPRLGLRTAVGSCQGLKRPKIVWWKWLFHSSWKQMGFFFELPLLKTHRYKLIPWILSTKLEGPKSFWKKHGCEKTKHFFRLRTRDDWNSFWYNVATKKVSQFCTCIHFIGLSVVAWWKPHSRWFKPWPF